MTMKFPTKIRSFSTCVSSPRIFADSVKHPLALARALGALLVALYLLSVTRTEAATATWDAGEAPDTNWITDTFGNWSGDADPSGKDVVFGATGLVASNATVTNTVNQSLSINSLTYQYNSAPNWHVTDIAAGKTLTVGGATNVFTVGGLVGTTQNITNTVIQGAGSLAIAQSGGTVSIGNFRSGTMGTGSDDSTHSKVSLDMHGLASFSANLGSTGNVYIGTPSTGSGNLGGYAVVSLAQASAITAGNLYIGSSLTNVNSARPEQTPTSLSLGKTNTINANNIWIGSGAANSLLNGRMDFVAADSSATFRAADGTGRVTSFYVGVKNLGATTGGVKGAVDFTGSTVDLLANEMIIGQGASQNPNVAEGTFIMNKGTVDTTTLVLGKGYNTYSVGTTTTGTLTINGGEFIAGSISSGEGFNASATYATGSVNGIINVANDGALKTGTLKMATSLRDNAANVGAITSVLNIDDSASVEVTDGGITMGQRAGGSDLAALTATINLDGGSLTVNGSIAEGSSAATSTINLNGGSLDMLSHSISVDNFNAKSGALSNVGQLNGDLVKTTAGTLILSGTNTYTGNTTVSAGTLNLSQNAALTFVIGANGVNNQINGTGTAFLDGNFVFNLSGADTTDGNSWLIVDVTTLNETFGSNFAVYGFSDAGGGDWTLAAGPQTWTFQESTGVLSVIPEPSSILLLSMGGLLLLAGRRRMQRA